MARIPEWAFVALGSNIGDRARYLAFGRQRLARLPRTGFVATTSVEETEPIDGSAQPPYLNQMMLLATELAPRALLEHCHAIEAEAGRTRTEHWGPRTLDLDIVRYGDLIIREPDLSVPHPELPNRPFWLREVGELKRHVLRAEGARGMRERDAAGDESPRLPVVFPEWARASKKRRAHIERVAGLLAHWADRMAVSPAERERWLRAAAYHDAVKDASPGLLRGLAPDGWDVDTLRHGPAAAVLAANGGEKDDGVLAAVRYHSVGFAEWDQVGQMLYLADYLEAGRKGAEEDHPALRARVPADVHAVLCEIARRRIAYQVERGRALLPETLVFWDALTCDD